MPARWGAAAVVMGFATVATPTLADTITVTDIAGRTVEVPENPNKVILGEGRMMYALSVLKRDEPFDGILGWKDDLILYDPDAFRRFEAAFPNETKELIDFGNPYSGDFSVESAVANGADLLLLDLGNLYKAQESGVIDNLAKVGVPVVFIDFRIDPTQNTIPSLLLLGRLFGEEKNAAEFIDFYMQQMRRVQNIVQDLPVDEKPLVFVENAAGWDPEFCCNTFGSYNFGRFVELAGGRNWGSEQFSGYRNNVSLEAVVTDNPDVIVGTGANWAEARPEVGAVLLGYDAQEDAVQEKLSALADREGFKDLDAIKNGRFHSIYHQFYNGPYHFIAIQALAKWLHPEDFEDLDPQATFVELHERFLPFESGGHFWATLKQ